VKTLGAVLGGVLLGIAGMMVWLRWFFRDVMR